jgi:hypothetical protein
MIKIKQKQYIKQFLTECPARFGVCTPAVESSVFGPVHFIKEA